MTTNIRPEILALESLLIAMRRDFHRHPELGFEEIRTAKIVAERLREYGFDVQEGLAKTGVVGNIGSGEKTLAFRADMDALPIFEKSGHDYCSVYDGKMHACGHDGHTAILLGFAKWLGERAGEIGGKVKLIFQPSEEGNGGGALPMIEQGVLENPRVDALFGLHLWNLMPVGTIGLRSGPLMACADEFSIRIVGKGGHGAQPDLCIDPIVVAAQVVSALQTIVSRSVDPQSPAVVTIGKIEGGTNFNIIAPDVLLSGTARSFDEKLRTHIQKRIGEITESVCVAMEATCEYDYERHYPASINDDAMTELAWRAAKTIVAQADLIEPQMTMGGEDMSYYLQKVPGCFAFLGSSNPEKGFDKSHHHPQFDFDESALAIGVELFARICEEYFDQGT